MNRCSITPYDEAHLFVAAIRILQHQKKCLPAIEDICTLLNISLESGLSQCRKLQQAGIVETFADSFSLKASVSNHLAIEKIPREDQSDNALAKELENFMSKKKDLDKKVETIQAELAAKKKTLFKNIEDQLKKNA